MFMNRDDRRVLRALFGHRVRFDEAERRLYRYDLWRPPAGVRRFVRSTPEAVVLPETEAELQELVRFAKELGGVPLVPRGGGTAMNGGSMPTKGGIVVDFAFMDSRFEPSADDGSVLVGAGMTFASLAGRLSRMGRAPLLEPVFPEATTVGGWLATGGVGFGSNRFGPVEAMVRSVRLVLPDGSRRVFSGSELDVVAGMCGSTGFITAVELVTRPAGDPVPFLASFNDLASVDRALGPLRKAAPWWTMVVESPETAALKAEALGSRPPARNAFLVTAAALEGDWDDGSNRAAKEAVEQAGGKVVDDKKTREWWDLHREVYRAKSLGPSIVSQAMVVPTGSLAAAMSRVHDAVKAPHWSMTGVLAGERSLLVGYALDDERRPPYEMAYGAVIAMKHALGRLGARPASLGVQNADQVHRMVGEDHVERVQEFQRAVDPQGIMNPGKVFGTQMGRFKPEGAPGPTVQMLLKPGEPVLAWLHGSSYVRYQRGAEARAPYKAGLSAALGTAGGGRFGAKWSWDVVASDADAGLRHAGAGARAFGSLASSPLGWLHWIKDYLYGRSTLSAYQFRLLAGEGIAAEAELKSRSGLRFSDMLIDLKAQLLGEGFRPVTRHREIEEHCRKTKNVHGRKNEDRALWAEGLDLKDKGATLMFVDDTVSFEAPAFARRMAELLREAGEEPAYLGAEEWSSGHVLLSTGQHETARMLVEHNVKAIAASGAKTVVTLDPWTHHVFTRIYPGIAQELGLSWDVKVRHVLEVLAGHVGKGRLKPGEDQVEMLLHHPPVLLLHGIDEATAAKALSVLGIQATALPEPMDVGASGAVAQVYPELVRRACHDVFEQAAPPETPLVSSDVASGLLLQEASSSFGETAPVVHLLGEPVPRSGGAAGPADGGEEPGTGPEGSAEGEGAQQEADQAA